jgi:hypothetical protein
LVFISQKTTFFIVSAVHISNLTFVHLSAIIGETLSESSVTDTLSHRAGSYVDKTSRKWNKLPVPTRAELFGRVSCSALS